MNNLSPLELIFFAALEKGALDMILDRRLMRDRLPALLAMLQHRPAPG